MWRFKSLIQCTLSQLDRTEVIKSNLHPVFAKVFSLDYYFEEVQKLRFEVYDIHGTHSIGTRDDDFLGGVECTLGQVGRCQYLTNPFSCFVLLLFYFIFHSRKMYGELCCLPETYRTNSLCLWQWKEIFSIFVTQSGSVSNK